MIYLKLAFAYLQIGLLSIGGGHASIPVVKAIVVDGYAWMTEMEFTDMITLSEMTPGPFAINSATFVGLKIAGVFGGIIATVCFLIPSIIICLSLYSIYQKHKNAKITGGLMRGIRPAVAGLITSAGFLIFLSAIFGANTLLQMKNNFNFDIIALILFVFMFIIARKTKINGVFLIIISGALGGLIYSVL